MVQEKAQVRLTVAVAAYQVEKTLAECLDSLLNQEGDIEILCVDDGSADGTAAILRDYAARSERIRVITHETNRGTWQTRADAAAAAEGELITYVDGDDRLVPGACERMLRLWEEAHTDCLAFGFRCFADEQALKTDPDLPARVKDYGDHLAAYPEARVEGRDLPDRAWVEGSFPNTACAKVFRTADVRRCCERRPDGRYRMGEDQCFCFLFYAGCGSAVYVKEPLYEYRLGLGISSNAHDRSMERFGQICAQLRLIRFLRGILEEQGCLDRCAAALEKHLSNTVANIDAEWGVMRAGPFREEADSLIRRTCLPEMKAAPHYEEYINDRSAEYQKAEAMLHWKGPFRKVGTLLFCLRRWGPGGTLRILLKKQPMEEGMDRKGGKL